VNVPALNVGEIRVVAIQHFAPYVPHVTECAVTDGHLNAVSGVAHWSTAAKTIGWLQTHGAHAAVTKLLCNFCEHHGLFTLCLNFKFDR
jgi:hypothetical protein